MMVCEANIVVIVFRGFLSAKVGMCCSTLTVLQRERSSLLKIQVESTALLAYLTQRFWITSFLSVFC